MDQFEEVEGMLDAEELLAELTDKQKIAFAYHQLGFNQAGVGRIMGVSQQVACRHIQAAIRKFAEILRLRGV